MDDLSAELFQSKEAVTAFTMNSHHSNISLIFTVQNPFEKGKNRKVVNALKRLCPFKKTQIFRTSRGVVRPTSFLRTMLTKPSIRICQPVSLEESNQTPSTISSNSYGKLCPKGVVNIFMWMFILAEVKNKSLVAWQLTFCPMNIQQSFTWVKKIYNICNKKVAESFEITNFKLFNVHF